MAERTIRLSPGEYVNEPGILKHLPEYIKQHKLSQPVIITDETVKAVIPPYLPDGFLDQYPVIIFHGNCTYEEADRLADLCQNYDGIIAFGGGQLLDNVKLVADKLNIKLFNIPTVPSNCAALTTKSIVYAEGDHEMVANHRTGISISVVLVEPELLRDAPEHYILSGIGDTIAKYYEIRRRLPKDNLPLVTQQVSRNFIEVCHREMLHVKDVATLSELELKNLWDTIFLIAASVDNFADDDGRSLAAHTFYKAYVKIKDHPDWTHGEIVALGNLFQVTLEGNDKLVTEIRNFYPTIGLPVKLADLEITEAEIHPIAEYICLKKNTRMQSVFPDVQVDAVETVLRKMI